MPADTTARAELGDAVAGEDAEDAARPRLIDTRLVRAELLRMGSLREQGAGLSLAERRRGPV